MQRNNFGSILLVGTAGGVEARGDFPGYKHGILSPMSWKVGAPYDYGEIYPDYI